GRGAAARRGRRHHRGPARQPPAGLLGRHRRPAAVQPPPPGRHGRRRRPLRRRPRLGPGRRPPDRALRRPGPGAGAGADGLVLAIRRALAFGAHPDDVELQAGGPLAAWAGRGVHVELACFTAGEKGSPDPGTEPAELAAVRRAEATGAADAPGGRGAGPLPGGGRRRARGDHGPAPGRGPPGPDRAARRGPRPRSLAALAGPPRPPPRRAAPPPRGGPPPR